MTLIETEEGNMPEGVKEEAVKQKEENIDERDRYFETWVSSDKLSKERDEYQQYLDEKQAAREKRRQQRLQAEIPTEIPKTPFFDKLKNIGKTISEFLRAPNKEAERIRRFEAQSHERLQTTFRETGRKLRGLSGFLRGLGAATFAGAKEGIVAGTKTFSAKMQENSKSQRGSRAGSAPPPVTF